MSRAAEHRRDRLHRLVEELSDEAVDEAFALISNLALSDDGGLTAEEVGALDEAEDAIAAGEVRPFAEVRRQLGV